jgi:hypothetical protein
VGEIGEWDYINRFVDLSMAGCIDKVVKRSSHPAPTQPQHSWHAWTKPQYGAVTQLTASPSTRLPLSERNCTPDAKLDVQKVKCVVERGKAKRTREMRRRLAKMCAECCEWKASRGVGKIERRIHGGAPSGRPNVSTSSSLTFSLDFMSLSSLQRLLGSQCLSWLYGPSSPPCPVCRTSRDRR